MVLIHVKHRDESQFLFLTTLKTSVTDLAMHLTKIYNGRLKIGRISAEIEELAKHGTLYPPEILGLTPEQVQDLKLVDHYGEKCVPSGGFTLTQDPIGRRNGKQPKKEMRELLRKTIKDAKEMISKDLVRQDIPLTIKAIQDAIDLLRGAVMIVYPMKLPPHDVIRMEFENIEDLSGTQAGLEVIDPETAQLWFCGKEMMKGDKPIGNYIGNVENCKVVIKLSKRGDGPPAREPIMTEEERKTLMLHAYRKQEEFKKLEADEDDSYLNSEWADSGNLKRAFQGIKNIAWRVGK